MNTIIITSLTVKKLSEGEKKNGTNVNVVNDTVCYSTISTGEMASFMACEKIGNGFNTWRFQAFDAMVPKLKKLSLKDGDKINIQGEIKQCLDKGSNRFNVFCKVLNIELVNRYNSVQTHTGNVEEHKKGDTPPPTEKTQQKDRNQILSEIIRKGEFNLSDFDLFRQKY